MMRKVVNGMGVKKGTEIWYGRLEDEVIVVMVFVVVHKSRSVLME